MKTFRLLLVPVLCLALAPTLLAQDGGSPFDEPSFLRLAPPGPKQVGEEVRLRYASPDFALRPFSKRLELAWREELYFPGASYVAPHFERFELPRGAWLVVRSPDGSRRWTYRGFGKGDAPAEDGFWGIHVAGDKAIVELWSRVPLAAGAVVIDGFARGFEDEVFAFEPKAICGVDDSLEAKCFQSSEPTIYDRGRAVARLLINGTSLCTGWLVGDEGHVMTNNHCISNQNEAGNTNYEFMAEGGNCQTDCRSSLACPGQIVATSGTLIQADNALDYALILLPTNPTADFGFLQMRAGGAVVDERIYIPQHPGGWGKRIAVASSAAQDQSGFCEVSSVDATPCFGGPGDTGYFCDTRGGSSGSPVLAFADHLVVSLHHCANCPNRGVPIEAVIADLGANLPNNSVVGNPPPPPPPPSCQPKGASCTQDADCCSNKCKGKPGSKTCK
ncbi:MAG: serine protease [Acidobacteria bacterium]|nr:MAG: serine protease [Acidobacteriota bacterium]